jgi:hypothetical protein
LKIVDVGWYLVHGLGIMSCRYVQRFNGRLVFKAHRPLYDSTLSLRAIKRRGKGLMGWVTTNIQYER